MARLRVVLVFHLFQRPGLSDLGFEQTWSAVLEPLLGAIHHTPGVKVGLVLSGDALQDMGERHHEGVDWLKRLIDDGRVEMIATAHQEPVISAIPLRDGTGQLVSHATLVNRMFGVRPRGGWLPLGVWDPSLPRVMAKGGIEWTFVDERQLLDLGIGNTSGVYRTERDGYPLALLPVAGLSRDLVADTPVRQVIQRLKKSAVQGHDLSALCFEAVRPGRIGGVEGRSDQVWYATLLKSIAKTRQFESILPSEAARQGPMLGQLYLPSWAPDEVGVPWERHLVRYEEANRLHKKMQRVSRCVRDLNRAVETEAHSPHRPDPSLLSQARRYLYRAQHAGVYWHGKHAGIYDPGIRYHAWRNLIRAEAIALRALRRDQRMAVERSDYNCDGVEEIVLRTPVVSVTLDPARCGGATEISYFEMAFNLVDVMTRSEEHYANPAAAADLGEEDDFTDDVTDSGLGGKRLGRGLFTDDRPRVSFVERILSPSVTLSHVRRGNYKESTVDHRNQVWEVLEAERLGDEAVSARLGCDVLIPGAENQQIRLDKRYVVQRDGRIDVRVEVVNRSHEVLRTRLALEVNLALPPEGDSPVIQVGPSGPKPLKAHGDIQETDTLQILSESLTVAMAFGPKARIWHYPIETIFQDHGVRRICNQGHCILALWPVELWAKEKARFRLSLLATPEDLPTR